MAINQGRKRAKKRRNYKRRTEREKASEFGTIVEDNKGNKRLALD